MRCERLLFRSQPESAVTSEIVLSSANFHIFLDGDSAMLRSFIMAKKSQGPILVPCGTPAGTCRKSEHPRLIF